MKFFLTASITQKFLAGLTGLFLALFLLAHMAGNMLIFAGPKVYNLYAHSLTSMKGLVLFELILLFCFILHIGLTVFLSIKNYKARGSAYQKPLKGWKTAALYQKTLLAQGALILVFVILHLIMFKFGAVYEVSYEGQRVRDLFRLVVEVFQSPIALSWYVLALVVLSLHLVHGLSSALQSLGFEKSLGLQRLSIFYAIFVTLGFISQPVYVFLGGFL